MTEQQSGQLQASLQTVQPPVKPPLPKPLYRVVNPTLTALLRSSLHRMLSNALMLLTFQGRTSGKRYTIPVGYLQRGNRLFLVCHSAWSKNFRGAGAPVAVRLRGRLLRGSAVVIEDPNAIANVVQMMVEQRGEKMARRMGIMTDGDDRPAGTVFIEITLAEQP